MKEFSCLARLRVAHSGDRHISQMWSAHVHRHDVDLYNSLVFRTRVSYVMDDLCKGLYLDARLESVYSTKCSKEKINIHQLQSTIRVGSLFRNYFVSHKRAIFLFF